LLGELEGLRRFVVCDMEAGLGTMLRLRPEQVDVVVVVAQPTAKALEVASRAVRIAASRAEEVIVVANRVRSEEDVAMIRVGVGEAVRLVAVPDDEAIARADEEGVAPIDSAPDSPGVRALVGLAEQLGAGVSPRGR
jgi:CO dehydrogenase nickel-insertion accessory protein CooC1